MKNVKSTKSLIRSINRSDFRVAEYDGEFRIQRKTFKTKTTGMLWWKKETEVIEWCRVNKWGNPILILRGPISYREPSIGPFHDLKSAVRAIDIMIKGIKYHYC